MNGQVIAFNRTLPATPPAAMARVQAVEDYVLQHAEPVEIVTYHVLHAGVYSRTILLPASKVPGKLNVLTGALVKIPTTLTIAGRVTVMVGDTEVKIEGHAVIPAAAGRKQAFIAHEDTWITMSFRTDARTVEEAEAEFTDDHERLLSRTGRNEIVIGDMP